MTGSGILTMLMFLTLALFAYTQTMPRARRTRGDDEPFQAHACQRLSAGNALQLVLSRLHGVGAVEGLDVLGVV